MCPFSVSVCTLLFPNMFSSFSPWFMPLSDHTDKTLVLTSFSFWGAKCRSRETGRHRMLPDDCIYGLLAFRKCQSPPLVPSLNNLPGFTELEGGKEAGPVLGVFLLKQTGSISEWMAPTGSSTRPVQVFVAPAVQFRLDYSHCSMTSFALSVSSFR